jgi:hypothetical protein
MKRLKKYWYKFFHYECPVCGRLDDWKERQYGTEKPEDRSERHIYKQQYDNCMGVNDEYEI